jgi:hypothetical protein
LLDLAASLPVELISLKERRPPALQKIAARAPRKRSREFGRKRYGDALGGSGPDPVFYLNV